jgi:hypothetical protein
MGIKTSELPRLDPLIDLVPAETRKPSLGLRRRDGELLDRCLRQIVKSANNCKEARVEKSLKSSRKPLK